MYFLELNRFLKEMESMDEKYDVVIDGLNCSYHQEYTQI